MDSRHLLDREACHPPRRGIGGAATITTLQIAALPSLLAHLFSSHHLLVKPAVSLSDHLVDAELAAFCRGGNFLNVARNSPTLACAGTSRKT